MTFTDSFEHETTEVLEIDGHHVYALLRFPILEGSRIRVRRLGSSSTRAQALKLAVDGGSLRTNGVTSPRLALWSHTAPSDAEVVTTGPVTELQVWNAWSVDGVDSSWLGNAAIMIEQHANGWTLNCSDGVGDANFGDLIVWLGFTQPGE